MSISTSQLERVYRLRDLLMVRYWNYPHPHKPLTWCKAAGGSMDGSAAIDEVTALFVDKAKIHEGISSRAMYGLITEFLERIENG